MRKWLLVLGLAVAPLWAARSAETIQAVESHPARGEALDGGSEAFFVRFSGPVNHVTSRLFIAQSGTVLVTLNPRLNSAPDTLFARRGSLAPGNYELSWIAYFGNGEESGGIVPFSVRAGNSP
jgi:methionine-rich copper-binding protein CopC